MGTWKHTNLYDISFQRDNYYHILSIEVVLVGEYCLCFSGFIVVLFSLADAAKHNTVKNQVCKYYRRSDPHPNITGMEAIIQTMSP